jgi:cyclophilin family peptidyl-prolyl cis-trans isomerase
MKHSSIAFFALTFILSACSPSSPVTTTPPISSSSSSMTSTSTTNTNGWDGTILKGKHMVTLKTSKGDITLELDADLAPKTVTNFITLSQSGYYNDLTFHRVIPEFMIQGGDPTGNGTGGRSIYGAEFEDEIDETNATYKTGYKAGVIAMANRGPNTNGSQFFIMDTDYPLPPSYTIFGHVTKGQDIVNAIARVERDGRDMPVTKVTFSVEVK